MKIDLFNYKLPKELIAQKQIKPRDNSRLLILDRDSKKVEHKYFYDILDILTDNDVLVINNTKVFSARLFGKKKTGGKVEIFLTEEIDNNTWEVMIKGRGIKENDIIYLEKKLEARVLKKNNKLYKVKFNYSGKKLKNIFDSIGSTPLPPYIKSLDSKKIKKDYQTIYAKERGSVAAPTAGLHFTDKLLKKIKKKGIKVFNITLHIGLGTFAPVEVKDIKKHKIHHEQASIDKETSDNLNKLKKEGKNIIAVGTTTARTLEAFSIKKNKLSFGNKKVDIYIYPGYKYKFVDDLITNFHLPKSSLLFMISALANRKLILDIYRKAIKLKYRFFSFGDAMFITKKRK